MNEQEKTPGQILSEQLTFSLKNQWAGVTPEERGKIFAFAEDYKHCIDRGKTEWQFIDRCLDLLKHRGFVDIAGIPEHEPLAPGAKVYQGKEGKSLIFAVKGAAPLSAGLNVLAAHTDSPRIDLKINPLYEDSDLAFFDTHYYGGIKCYQWTAIPLAMLGRVMGNDGELKTICVGDSEGDPVFTITDLLPHLAEDQMTKNAREFIAAEDLDILAGSEPYPDDRASDRVKLSILNLLHEQYGMTEKHFANGEITFVPAFKARDVGLDRSMIGAYGHDDKSCAYAALRAMLDLGDSGPHRTAVCCLTDKEEFGGFGPQVAFFKAFVRRLCAEIPLSPGGTDSTCVLSNSSMLCADVNPGYDPNYAGVYDKKTASYLGRGLALTKSGTGNYAGMEFYQRIQDLLDRNTIPWQYGGFGKAGKGGGGSSAPYFADLGIEVLDCGIPVLSMHSPFEVISKIDLWTAYKAYAAFFKEA